MVERRRFGQEHGDSWENRLCGIFNKQIRQRSFASSATVIAWSKNDNPLFSAGMSQQFSYNILTPPACRARCCRPDATAFQTCSAPDPFVSGFGMTSKIECMKFSAVGAGGQCKTGQGQSDALNQVTLWKLKVSTGIGLSVGQNGGDVFDAMDQSHVDANLADGNGNCLFLVVAVVMGLLGLVANRTIRDAVDSIAPFFLQRGYGVTAKRVNVSHIGLLYNSAGGVQRPRPRWL